MTQISMGALSCVFHRDIGRKHETVNCLAFRNAECGRQRNLAALATSTLNEEKTMARTPKLDSQICSHCKSLQKELSNLQKTVAKQSKTTNAKPPKQRFFDEKWLAIRLGVSLKTVQAWRAKGEGPKWVKLGAAVRYRLRDVVAFEASRYSGGDSPQC
jgi:hypothetical protein